MRAGGEAQWGERRHIQREREMTIHGIDGAGVGQKATNVSGL